MSKEKTGLVLKRKINESITIDGETEVMIKGIKGKTVKLLIIAPKEVRIQREKTLKFARIEEDEKE